MYYKLLISLHNILVNISNLPILYNVRACYLPFLGEEAKTQRLYHIIFVLHFCKFCTPGGCSQNHHCVTELTLTVADTQLRVSTLCFTVVKRLALSLCVIFS